VGASVVTTYPAGGIHWSSLVVNVAGQRHLIPVHTACKVGHWATLRQNFPSRATLGTTIQLVPLWKYPVTHLQRNDLHSVCVCVQGRVIELQAWPNFKPFCVVVVGFVVVGFGVVVVVVVVVVVGFGVVVVVVVGLGVVVVVVVVVGFGVVVVVVVVVVVGFLVVVVVLSLGSTQLPIAVFVKPGLQ